MTGHPIVSTPGTNLSPALTRHWAKTIALVLMLLTLSGCAGLRPTVQPDFIALAGDARVLYEPGYEHYAERVAWLLPAAISQVEARHYAPFAEPVRVYLCGSDACFSHFVTTPRLAAAVIPHNRLILAPRLFGKESWRLQSILMHELSHLHFGQRLGHYSHTVPIWFHEGFASYVADGGGAEFSNSNALREAIRDGRHFHPEVDTPWERKKAAHWGLDIYMFYRQSLLFVEYLKSLAEDRFRDFVLALQEREPFDTAFARIYGVPLKEAGDTFFAGFGESRRVEGGLGNSPLGDTASAPPPAGLLPP